MRGREITAQCFMIMNGGDPVPLESLSEDQKTECFRRMAERGSRIMSDYYTAHPEEYAKLQ